MKHEWNTKMKHNNGKQHINTAMTLSKEKQKPYNNETNNEKQEWKTTIIQQSFNNEKVIKHTNETRQSTTTMKNNKETQQWHSAMKNHNRTTMKPTMKNKNETRQSNTTMKNNKDTQQWHSAMKNKNRTTMKPTMKEKNKKTNNLTTIIQQSFNNKKQMKHTNETKN